MSRACHRFRGNRREGRRMDPKLAQALEMLGVTLDSDGATVRRAYRRLARATHPDMSPDPVAAERFASVHAAYRLVCDAPRPQDHTRRRSASIGSPLLWSPTAGVVAIGGRGAEDRPPWSSDRARSRVLRTVPSLGPARIRAGVPIVA